MPGGQGSIALPPFARRYQGVCNPLGDGAELAKLLKAALGAEWDASIELLKEPFVGLRPMGEDEADRFFGRKAEVAALVDKFRRHRIVAIVADSGTGKSSLAQAGFAPAFRGGALADPARAEPDDRVWHVVTMRPGSNPEEGLREGVIRAAERVLMPAQTKSKPCGLARSFPIRVKRPTHSSATCGRRKASRRC